MHESVGFKQMLKQARRREAGVALVMALIAMAALTVLAVGGISRSNTDVAVSYNMRRLDQARYAAIAGSEHARRNLVLGILPTSDQVTHFDTLGATSNYYIDSTSAVAMTSANNVPLGTYTVKAVAVKCSGPPSGYSVDQFYAQYFDMHSTGIVYDTTGTEVLPATSTAVLTIRKVAEGRCFKR